MGLFKQMTAILLGAAIATGTGFPPALPSRAIAQTREGNAPLAIAELNQIAKNISVYISGETSGSGAIVGRQGNTYSVLTTQQALSGGERWELFTADGRRYRVSGDRVRRLPGGDLAVVEFTSDRDYPVAQLASPSDSNIYLAVATEPQTTLFAAGEWVSFPGNTPSPDYRLIYTSALQPTLSGGVVLDAWGRAVAIQARLNENATFVNAAIPIDRFLQFAPRIGVNLGWEGLELANAIATPGEVRAMTLSPDRSLLATASGNQGIQLWDWRGLELLTTLRGHDAPVKALAISADKRTLVSGDAEGKVILWNLRSGEILNTLNRRVPDAANRGVQGVAITSNQRTLATASPRGIELWELETGRLTLTLPNSADVTAIALTPNARTLVSGHLDNRVKVWNLLNGTLVRTLEAGEFGFVVEALAISPDGQRVAAGTYRQFTLWDLQSGQRQQTVALPDAFQYVYDLAFTPDGRAIASTSEAGTQLWDIATGRPIATAIAPARYLTFAADRTLLLGGDRIQIWQILSEGG
ncbi:WD40 repeat domain-containing protein [Phormidium sp. CCY1219]|uniref:WD40 repeat domain-containing protein n=1 Tax=Phormidium sp. CCY1219 TaxID=2886104 RepID=UPI002D1EF538|nr:trypsin-like peptidase domain-containing protein [Phormidium sp. CCY1219]MEB3831366.1 trypsin-like peptidase domain-containing protein [Phormidium sp. CCY1219]